MSRRKTAGFPGEKKIWKSRRILQRRARELLKARVYLREKEVVSTARRYRRHGGIEGMEVSKAWRYRRNGDIEGQKVSKTRGYLEEIERILRSQKSSRRQRGDFKDEQDEHLKFKKRP